MRHVLIVDDDRTTSRLLTMLLEIDGYSVSQFPRPQAVLEEARVKPVDVFIIDCNLAGHDGIELLKKIRSDADLADRPVIMTSGKDLSKETMAAGADVFLLKPFSTGILTSKLSELLGDTDSSESGASVP
jgi:DNA-binding response OmpR family regulator